MYLDGEEKIPFKILKDSDLMLNHIISTLRQLKNMDIRNALIFKLE